MKLFVWEDLTYGGIMFAIAESVEEAKELLMDNHPNIPEEDFDKEPVVSELFEKLAYLMWKD